MKPGSHLTCKESPPSSGLLEPTTRSGARNHLDPRPCPLCVLALKCVLRRFPVRSGRPGASGLR